MWRNHKVLLRWKFCSFNMLYLVLYKHCLQELKKRRRRRRGRRYSTSWYFCALDSSFSEYVFYWALSLFTTNVSKVKIKSTRFWAQKGLNKWNQQRAENEMLLDTKDLCEVLSAIKITLIEIHGDEENTIMHQRRSPIIIQRIAFALFLLNDVRLMWRIMHIDKNENAMLLFTSSFPTPETGLLDAISPRKRGC